MTNPSSLHTDAPSDEHKDKVDEKQLEFADHALAHCTTYHGAGSAEEAEAALVKSATRRTDAVLMPILAITVMLQCACLCMPSASRADMPLIPCPAQNSPGQVLPQLFTGHGHDQGHWHVWRSVLLGWFHLCVSCESGIARRLVAADGRLPPGSFAAHWRI